VLSCRLRAAPVHTPAARESQAGAAQSGRLRSSLLLTSDVVRTRGFQPVHAQRTIDPQSTSIREQPGEVSELELARIKIAQLEQALTSRIVVDVAVGVLIERHALPRQEAFELLRRAARHHRRRIHDLAAEVVADRAERPEIATMRARGA